jgi:hypothetical protein
MTQTQVLNWLAIIAASVAVIAVGLTLAYLGYVREKIRRHRDVRNMVSQASTPFLPFESGTHAKQR